MIGWDDLECILEVGVKGAQNMGASESFPISMALGVRSLQPLGSCCGYFGDLQTVVDCKTSQIV